MVGLGGDAVDAMALCFEPGHAEAKVETDHWSPRQGREAQPEENPGDEDAIYANGAT